MWGESKSSFEFNTKSKSKPSYIGYDTTIPAVGKITPKNSNVVLPSIGKFNISVAPTVPIAAETQPISEENCHSFIQHVWSTFSTLNDSHRNQLLRGLLSRCSSQQIEHICTCLNIKSLDSSKSGIHSFPGEISSKYAVKSRKKPHEYSAKGKLGKEIKKVDEDAGFRDAMRRVFAEETGSGEKCVDYSVSSKNGSYLNRGSYIRLLNKNMDPHSIVKQAASSGPEGIKFLMSFLATQCTKFKDCLQSIISISEEITVEGSISKLFETLAKISDARMVTIYYLKNNRLMVYVSNWQPNQTFVSEKTIFACDNILRRDFINISNMKTSEFYDGEVAEKYNPLDPECVMSAPFFGVGKKVAGFIELLGKKEGNPIFDLEDEFLLKNFAALTTIVFERLHTKHVGEEKQQYIRDFVTTANHISSTDLGELINEVMNTVRALLNADKCTIYIYDAQTNELWSRGETGAEEIRIPADYNITGVVYTTGKVCIIDNAYNDPRFDQYSDQLTGYTTKTILCVPVTSPHGYTIGVVEAKNKLDGECFNEDDVNQLQSFASLAASTLQKSDEWNVIKRDLFDTREELLSTRSLLKNLNRVIITIGANGLVKSIENAEILHLSGLLATMKLTTYDHWLGKENSGLADDIKSVLLGGDEVTTLRTHFYRPEKEPILINYNIRMVPKDTAEFEKLKQEIFSKTSSSIRSISVQSSHGNYTADSDEPTDGGIEVLVVLEVVGSLRYFMESTAGQMTKNNWNTLLSSSKYGGCIQYASAEMYKYIKLVKATTKSLLPEQIIKMLRKFYDMIIQVTQNFDGIVTDMKADSAVIVFGTVVPIPTVEKVAIDASLALQKGIDDYNRNSDDYGLPAILASIGVASGMVLAGAIGPTKLEQYCALGNPINDATVLQTIATNYGSRILLCSKTLEVVKDMYHIREVDIVSPRSGAKSFVVNEIMATASNSHKNDLMSTILCYELGLAEYRARNWQAAMMHFKKAQTLTDDYPAKYMSERCRSIIDGQFDIPADWDGSWQL